MTKPMTTVSFPTGEYKLVPIVPDSNMVVDGFESAPDEHFSKVEEWEAFQEMSGCQQSAHKARLCYAAMIAAVPAIQPGVVVHEGEPVGYMHECLLKPGRWICATINQDKSVDEDVPVFTHPPKPAQDNAALIEAEDARRYEYLIDCDYISTKKYLPDLVESEYKDRLRTKHSAAIASFNVGQPVQEG